MFYLVCPGTVTVYFMARMAVKLKEKELNKKITNAIVIRTKSVLDSYDIKRTTRSLIPEGMF